MNQVGRRAVLSEFQARRLRTETEFTDFAGSRTQTAPATGPPFSIFQARGLRTKTEFIGFADSRTQTAPAPGLSTGKCI